jgi:glycosyltransferase involved in cell wall biosynthesis
MIPHPPYAVVIPACNAAATVAETIRSVAAQQPAPATILVVDDGSTDATAAVAEAASPLVRVLRQDNRGVGSATTAGIAAVTTPILAAVDADDLWLPGKMAAQLGHLAAHPASDAVFAAMRGFHADGSAAGLYPGMLRSTLVMRTEAARRIGPICDPPGGRGDLVDWLARARELGLILDTLDTVLALRRIHPGSLSFGRDPDRDRGYAYVAWQALKRRRERSP